MNSSKNSKRGYHLNKESNKSHQKFDFGRCKICKDKATGIHYGIPSCEGCKGFYKRSIDKHQEYVCYFGSKCSITPRQRRRCKLCRWKLCVEVGMSLDSIKMGRISKAQKEKVKRIIDYDNIVENIENQMLSPKQMILAKEIRQKCYQTYIEFSKDMVDIYQRAVNCLKTNKPEPLQADRIDQETIQFIKSKVLNKMGENTKKLVIYIKSLPGMSQLDTDDLSALFDKYKSILFGLTVARSYIEGELFFVITENIRLTRSIMARLIGVAAQKKVFNLHQRFNNLGLNDREMSLLMPTIITDTSLKYPKKVTELHQVYKQALTEEFNLNNRTDEFIYELVEVLALL